MPRARAVSMIFAGPTFCANCTAMVFTELASAYSRVIRPSYLPEKLDGCQPLKETGLSTTGVAGVIPASNAAR